MRTLGRLVPPVKDELGIRELMAVERIGVSAWKFLGFWKKSAVVPRGGPGELSSGSKARDVVVVSALYVRRDTARRCFGP